MAILENRAKSYNNLSGAGKLFLSRARRSSIVIFVICSLYLLYSAPSRRLSLGLLEATGNVVSVGASLCEYAASRIKFITDKLDYLRDLETENIELRLEIASLKKLQHDIQSLQVENAALRQLLHFVEEPKAEYITAKLLSVSLNPLGTIAIIGGGWKQGMKADQIVLNSRGLVGRIIEVSNNYAKVMLVTDLNSRIPVITSGSRERGILVGDTNKTKLVYLAENHNVQPGEMIMTSGDGKIYPPGIAVARVTSVSPNYIIAQPLADLRNTDLVVVSDTRE